MTTPTSLKDMACRGLSPKPGQVPRSDLTERCPPASVLPRKGPETPIDESTKPMVCAPSDPGPHLLPANALCGSSTTSLSSTSYKGLSCHRTIRHSLGN